MLNIRWCVFTGALMLAFVGVTFVHKEVAQDPPGVHTRWWDGTTQSVDTQFPDGKPRTHTEFSDDGKTVLLAQEWEYGSGALIHEKKRHKDGRVEEKVWYRGGKQLETHTLWLGDEMNYQAQIRYYPNGKMASQDIKTEDGQLSVDMKQWDDKGVIQTQVEIRSNAEQVQTFFQDGKKYRESILEGTGDRINASFWDNENYKMRTRQVKLDNSTVTEAFYRDGSLRVKIVTQRNYDSEVSVFAPGDKLKLKQSFKNDYPVRVEEISIQTGKPTRVLTIGRNERVEKVEIFRADGTLEKVKQLAGDGKVIRTTEYNADGKTVASEKDGGDSETINPKLLRLPELGEVPEEGDR